MMPDCRSMAFKAGEVVVITDPDGWLRPAGPVPDSFKHPVVSSIVPRAVPELRKFQDLSAGLDRVIIANMAVFHAHGQALPEPLNRRSGSMQEIGQFPRRKYSLFSDESGDQLRRRDVEGRVADFRPRRGRDLRGIAHLDG